MNIKFLCDRVFISGAFAGLLFVSAFTVSAQVKIADLKNPDVVVGCSCSFQSVSESKKPDSRKWMFVSELGTNEGWMNINGKDTKLRLVKTTQNQSAKSGVGSRFYEEYTASGLKVRIDYVTTRTCPKEDDDCEHINYAVTFTVTKGRVSKTQKAVGACGC